MDAPTADALVRATIAVLALVSCVAAAGLALRDNSIVDVFWSVAFVVAALAAVSAVPAADRGPRTMLTLLVLVVWATRLSLHIARRRRHHRGEDWRYAAWRANWGPRSAVLRSAVQVYLLQGLLALCCSTAVLLIVVSRDQQLDAMSMVGLAVWVIGFTIEVVADAQLSGFLARKRAGQASGLCTEGLWSRSRHPNYFGEAVLWWGISIMALGVPHGWIGLTSGVLVTILVRYVSGVPVLERAWRSRAGFDEWASVTPVFVPRLRSTTRGGSS